MREGPWVMDKFPSLAMLTWLVHPGHLSRRSAVLADEGTVRLLATSSEALHHLSSECDFELATADTDTRTVVAPTPRAAMHQRLRP